MPDYGPATKLIGALVHETDPNTLIMIGDDDVLLHDYTLEIAEKSFYDRKQLNLITFNCEEWSGWKSWLSFVSRYYIIDTSWVSMKLIISMEVNNEGVENVSDLLLLIVVFYLNEPGLMTGKIRLPRNCKIIPRYPKHVKFMMMSIYQACYGDKKAFDPFWWM